jgi:hypothetical protein
MPATPAGGWTGGAGPRKTVLFAWELGGAADFTGRYAAFDPGRQADRMTTLLTGLLRAA